MFTNSDHSKCTLISESNWIAKLQYAHWIFWEQERLPTGKQVDSLAHSNFNNWSFIHLSLIAPNLCVNAGFLNT
ncbi:unnamed protein product [Caretta caretta]